jgi:hypothetical protein
LLFTAGDIPSADDGAAASDAERGSDRWLARRR